MVKYLPDGSERERDWWAFVGLVSFVMEKAKLIS